MTIINLDAWTSSRSDEYQASNNFTTASVSILEQAFGSSATVFNSMQSALEAIISAFDVNQEPIPVIMAVNAPVWALTAILRAGAQPIILDVDEYTHQLNPSTVAEVLSDVPNALTVLWRPLHNSDLCIDLLNVLENYVTIQVTHSLPLESKDLIHKTHFAIYDLVPAANQGALVFTKFEDLHQMVREAKAADSGLVSPFDACLAYERLSVSKSQYTYLNTVHDNASMYAKLFAQVGVKTLVPAAFVDRYFPVQLNADLILPQCHLYDIVAISGFSCLHMDEKVKLRYKSPVSYEIAEGFHNKIVYLPCHPGISPTGINYILNTILRVL